MRLGDEVAWSNYLGMPSVIEHTSFPTPDVGSVRGWVERAVTAYSTNEGCRWALANPEDQLIGTCGFSSWSLAHGHAELVYDLDPQCQGRGLMSRAVEEVVRWVFAEQSIHRVHAFVMTSNEPSIGLLKRCGFGCEGTLRAFRIARGKPRDFYIYARLKSGQLRGASPN